MKPHKKELPVPEGRRFWAVDLGTEEEPNLYHFRMPRYTVAYGLKSLHGAGVTLAVDSGDLYALLAGQLRTWAAAIGVCWANRMAVLESAPPTGWTAAELAEYGENVLDELQDRYDDHQIKLLGERAMEELEKRLEIVALAAQRAKDFEEAKKKEEDGTSPEGSPVQSSPEKSST